MEQVLSMIYGLALGDALGAPMELWDLKGIRIPLPLSLGPQQVPVRWVIRPRLRWTAG
jgi:hypothetical protein